MELDDSSVTVSTTADHRGYFLLCDVPYGSSLQVAVRHASGEGPAVQQTFLVPPEVLAVVKTITMSR